jgi:translation initiation factor IF-2
LATNKRISQLAKELSVTSAVILEKCWAEGISKELVKAHNSTVSAGLEQSIREWFSGEGGSAVETAARVELDAVKAKPAVAKRRVKSADDADANDAGGAQPESKSDAKSEPKPEVRTAAKPKSKLDTDADLAPGAPSDPKPAAKAEPKTDTKPDAKSEPKSEPKPEPRAEVIAPSQSRAEPKPDTRPDLRTEPKPDLKSDPRADVRPSARPAAPTRLAPTTISPAPEARPSTHAASSAPAAASSHPAAGSAPAPAAGHAGDAAATIGTGPNTGSNTGPGGSAPSTRPGGTPPRHAVPSKPAPMNVPTRPTVIAPAGPRLQAPVAVQMKGPKVVRVEAPEAIEAPRPRRYPGPGGSGGPGLRGPREGGPVGAPGAADDDRGRSPRRKPGAGASSSSSSAAAKRSTGQGVPQRRRATSGEEWVGGQVFSEQDLIEREARLLRAGGFLKKRVKDLKKPGELGRPLTAAQTGGAVEISAPFTLKDLSATTGVKAADISKKLFLQGVMLKINDPMPVEKAVEVMMEFNIDLRVKEASSAEETVSKAAADREMTNVRPRGPVVTILGHVDHGKTSLLDKIRNANVAAGEAGGITQRTSAFIAEIDIEDQKKQVVFLDTPGHEAFTSMRSRGAKMTDVVVLVVSAPEGVMPQTIESINHAKAAKVPIVVALNKVDRPDATESQIQRVMGDLAKAGINPVEWGGDTEVVRVSATTGLGIPKLLEILDLQASVLELTADFDGPAQGTVIESRMEEGRGAVANILLQHGKLEVGDFVVMGRAFGRVRDITDDRGRRIKQAVPPLPVQISGIDTVCDAGDKFYVTPSLKQAEDAAEQRRQRERHTALAAPKLTLDSLFSQMQGKSDAKKEILIVLKVAEQGTLDVLRNECEKIKSDEVAVRVLDAGVGGISESNVLLSEASKAIIIGFNVIPSGKARALAEQRGVEIRTYQVIYDIVEDLKKAAEGLLTPELREEVLGHAEVRKVFKVTKVGNIAGCYVTDGIVQRDALIRVTRNGVIIENDRKLAQLKRVKDDAKEARAGVECGMKIDGYDDIKEGDILECYKKIEVKRTL